jgi:glucosamine--fructose-6-phosphate aminotransferase (isomerizing)
MVTSRAVRRTARFVRPPDSDGAYAPPMSTSTIDPNAPLPGPPDPWRSTSQPSRRESPPFHMTDMIEAEPALAARILARNEDASSAAGALAGAITRAIKAGGPVVVTGCGTSDHAAQGVAEILREAVRAARLTGPAGIPAREPVAEQALELSLDPPASGLVIGVSHEGATPATNAALAASRAAGARTALITVTDRSPGSEHAHAVLPTEELDQGWCHTVGYLSPLVAATAVAAHIARRPVDEGFRTAVRELLQAGVDRSSIAEAVAARLAGVRQILVIASGADRPAGRELVLKIEEGTWIPAAYRDLETFLHGHLAATDDSTGLVLVLTDRDHREERLERARGALRAAQVIGMEAAAIVTADIAADLPTELTPAGRIVVPEAPTLPSPVAALIGTATPLQSLTERLARARGVDPDAIHRDVDLYREAADAAD